MILSVACVGLGRMGSGIASNIQKSSFRLTVYNRTTAVTEKFPAAITPRPRQRARASMSAYCSALRPDEPTTTATFRSSAAVRIRATAS